MGAEVLNSLDTLQSHASKLSYGVTINELNGKYVYVNPIFCEITEFPVTELLQMGFKDVTHPDDVGVNVELDEQLRNGEIPFLSTSKKIHY